MSLLSTNTSAECLAVVHLGAERQTGIFSQASFQGRLDVEVYTSSGWVIKYLSIKSDAFVWPLVSARCYFPNTCFENTMFSQPVVRFTYPGVIQCISHILLKIAHRPSFLEGNWMNVLSVGCAVLLAYFIYKKLSSLGDCCSLKARRCFLLWLHFKLRP